MKSEKGFTLIEVVAAIALLGIVAVAFLGALGTGSMALKVADERATAESLARSQVESVKNQDYIDYSVADHAVYDEISTPPGSGYSLELTVAPIDPNTGVPYGETGGKFDQDDGIQKITVLVYHPYDADNPEDWVVKLEGYKGL